MKRFFIFWALPFLAGIAVPASGSPVYDPFMEKFQVGVFRDPEKILMEAGYPKGLMEPILPDSVWINAAARILDPNARPAVDLHSRSLLEACHPDSSDARSWLFHHHKRLAELELVKLPATRPYHVGGKFLLADRLAIRVFLAFKAGQFSQAAELADRLTSEGEDLGLKSRQIFVWDLRARYLKSLTPNSREDEEGIWPTLFGLGSFDSGNGWAIWVARQKSLGRSVITPDTGTEKLGQFLGKLRKTWLGGEDLYQAGFDAEMVAALGAKILPKNKLATHFEAHPHAPDGLTLQGWWVGGQRRLNHGDAIAYETLASREDLTPAWSMDVYRRASEIHILAGNWSGGMVDLKESLLLAKNGHGTRSLRRRLRQWNEQAIALASAQGESAIMAELLELGRSHFQGEELAVFEDQTLRWGEIEPFKTEPEISKNLVATGAAPDFRRNDLKKSEAFASTADDFLWDSWFRWGQQIINGSGATAELMTRGLGYTENKPKIEAIYANAAIRFPQYGTRETLLRMTLEFDIGVMSQWRTTPWQSPVPALVKESVKGPRGRHALLGVALTTGDMRGILSAATELPRKSLTSAEKQRFLFPLPLTGSVRDAIEAAESDPALILAVARNESLFDPAVRSRAGALGFMQIMPFHYEARGANFGKDHWSQPAVSIAFGDRLLQEGTRRYKGDPYMSLAGYNAGPKPAARWLEQLGGTCSRQEYVSWIGYAETRYYVEKVLLDREIYDAIIAGSGKELVQ